MKTHIALAAMLAVLFSVPAYSAGYSSWAVPTGVELVNGGLLISGSFGDPHSCGEPGHIFVPNSNSRFKELVSMAYSALIGGRQLRFYSSSCAQVITHWSGYVINANQEGQAAMMR